MDILNQVSLDKAAEWVEKNVKNDFIQSVIAEAIDQTKRRVLHSQIELSSGDCAFVFRSWGNEIYVSNEDAAEDARLKLAVAVRAVASQNEEPNLWEYLHDFQPDAPKFELILGGKE